MKNLHNSNYLRTPLRMMLVKAIQKLDEVKHYRNMLAGRSMGFSAFLKLATISAIVFLAISTDAGAWICFSKHQPLPPRMMDGLGVVDAGPDQFICLGGSVQLSASGADSYQWAPSAGLSCSNCPDPLASPSATTIYVVTGNDGSTDTVGVVVSSPPTLLAVVPNNVTDCQIPNGSIVIKATGAAGALEYSITGRPWQSSPVFLSAPTGAYQVFARNANGSCEVGGGTVTLTGPTPPQVLNVATTNPTACGSNDGVIAITASGGSGTFQYSVDGGNTWQPQNSFQQLGAGHYQIKVRNSGGSCEVAAGQVVLTGSPLEADIVELFVAQPTNCGLQDGLITLVISNDDGNFEFSVDGGAQYQASNFFPDLGAGQYHVLVRRSNGTCVKDAGFVGLTSSNAPGILGVSVAHPQTCGANDGAIAILATGPSTVEYSINGGSTWQLSHVFENLPAGGYSIAARNEGGGCFTSNGVASLVRQGTCSDTLHVVIPAGGAVGYCLDPSVFEISGNPTGAGFCNQGNLATVMATEVNGRCVTLAPANGFTGTSPHTICVVHCFNNSISECDTTYLIVTVSSLDCDALFAQDTIAAQFFSNPTPVCIPIPPATAGTYDLFLNGTLLANLPGCDFDSVVIYSYPFLPGGGFNGPYILNSWAVNGNTFTGFITNVVDLVGLMNAFDPTGNWQINTVTGIIFGGNLANNYGNIQLAHVPSGSTSLMTANFTILPNGFNVNLSSTDLHTLLAINPADGCADTLYINPSEAPPPAQVVHLTTVVNQPTDQTCLDASRLPGGSIGSVGYCKLPAHGTAPIVGDSCIMYFPNQDFVGQDTFCLLACGNGFPQTCDSTIFIVTVLPESETATDTVFQTTLVNIGLPPACANTSELPGDFAGLAFCKLPAHGAVAVVNDTCIAYQPNINFTGTDGFCVVLCDDSQPAVCDTFVYIVKIALPIDTVVVDAPGVAPFDVCLGGNVLQLPGAIVSAVVCASNPAEVGLGFFENCITVDPANDFIGTTTACVIHCDNNNPSICDTTILIIKVPDVCSLVDFFPADTVALSVNNCSALMDYCVPLKVDSLGSYGVLDNGVQYAGGFGTCNQDQLQIMLDTGYHEVIFIHLATGCADTLQANVSCETGTPGCGVAALSPLTMTIPGCDDLAQFCLGLNMAELPRFSIKHEAEPVMGFVPCGAGNGQVALSLPVGSHILTVADTTKGCVDTFVVDIACPLYQDATLDTVVMKAASRVLCLADFGFPVSQIDNVVNECAGQGVGNVAFSIDPATWCITVHGLGNGLDSACFRVLVGGTNALFTVRVSVQGVCPDWLPDTLITAAACESNAGLLCVPVSFTDLQGKVLSVDGVVYTGTVTPCDFDSIFILNYSEFPGMGIAGPYTLLGWMINGASFTGVFNNPRQLADSMSVWDAFGDWEVVVDAATQSVFITGGSPANTYGVFDVSQNSTGIRAQLGINAVFKPNGIGLAIAEGTHSISISDPATGCTDSTLVSFFCVSSEMFFDTVSIGESNIFCPDLSELHGALANVANACPGSGGGVEFAVQGSCINYKGNQTGRDSACLVICDDLGICDTTYLFITVVAGTPGPNAVNDTVSTLPGQVVVTKVLNNDTFGALVQSGIVSPPTHGQAVMMADGSVIYTPGQDYCDDALPDSFTYQICDAVGCDTATVFVSVKCSALEVFNAFSPNGDKINDFFKINGLQNFPNHQLWIYNRWGNLVFEGVSYQNTWDGTFNGKDLPDGTYFYVLDMGNGGKPLSGFVHLNR